MSTPRGGLADMVQAALALFSPLTRQNVGYKNIVTTYDVVS